MVQLLIELHLGFVCRWSAEWGLHALYSKRQRSATASAAELYLQFDDQTGLRNGLEMEGQLRSMGPQLRILNVQYKNWEEQRKHTKNVFWQRFMSERVHGRRSREQPTLS